MNKYIKYRVLLLPSQKTLFPFRFHVVPTDDGGPKINLEIFEIATLIFYSVT